MSALTTITVREVFERFLDTGQVLIAKNLPPNVRNQQSLLENYFEVICDNSIEALHFPTETDSIALIVFEEKAQDYEKYRRSLSKKPLLNATVDLSPLGRARGLVITDVPDAVSDELLMNYFENKRSGGCGDCVEDTMSYSTGRRGCKLVVIVISDVKVMKSILARPVHCVAEQTLNVEPYFPGFHDYLLNKLLPCPPMGEPPGKAEQTLGVEKMITSIETQERTQRAPHTAAAPRPEYTSVQRTQQAPHTAAAPRPEYTSVQRPEQWPVPMPRPRPVHAGNTDRFVNPDLLTELKHTISHTSDNNSGSVVYKNNLDSEDELTPANERKSVHVSHMGHTAKAQNDDFQNVRTSVSGLKIYFSGDKEKPVDTKQAVEAPSIPRMVPARQEEHVREIKSPERTFEKFQRNEGIQNKFAELDMLVSRPYTMELAENPLDNSDKIHSADTYSCKSEEYGHQSSLKFDNVRSRKPEVENTSGMDLAKHDGPNRNAKPQRRRGNKNRQPNERPPQSIAFEPKDGETTEKVPLNSKQLQLLRIGAFYKKLTVCKSSPIERESCVIFTGMPEEINKGKLNMYETLQKVHDCSENMPLETVDLLARPECKICIKERLIRGKIYAVVEADVGSSSLQSSAFYTDCALKGIAFVKNEISEAYIKLREGQISMLKQKEWTNLVDQLNTGLAYIGVENISEITPSEEHTEPRIVIKSLMRQQVGTVRQSVIDFLKSNTPRRQTKFSLCGAEARCFQAKFEAGLQKTISQMRGQIEVRLIPKDTPIQLDVMVTGDTMVTSTTEDCLKRIWHETFDFSKVLSLEKDIRLLMHGLEGTYGHTFIQGVERSLDCFIDLTKKGEMSVKPLAIETKHAPVQSSTSPENDPNRTLFTTDVDDLDDIQPRHMDASVDEGDEGKLHYIPRKRPTRDPRSVIDTQRLALYQPGVTYEEALQQALQESKSEGDLMQIEQEPEYRSIQSVGSDSLIYDRANLEYEDQFDDDEGSLGAMDYAPRQPRNRNIHHTQPPRPHPRSRGYSGDTGHAQQTESVQVQGTTISVERGAIAQHTADVLVNVLPPSGDINKESVISKSFVEAGGMQLVQSFAAARQNQQLQQGQSRDIGQVVPTSSRQVISTPTAGQLNCKMVYHVTLKKMTTHPGRIITEVMDECLRQCTTSRYTSISFPALGVGRLYQYPAAAVVDTMLKAATASAQTNRNIMKITFMAFDSDTFKVFTKGLTKFRDDMSKQQVIHHVHTPHGYQSASSVNQPNQLDGTGYGMQPPGAFAQPQTLHPALKSTPVSNISKQGFGGVSPVQAVDPFQQRPAVQSNPTFPFQSHQTLQPKATPVSGSSRYRMLSQLNVTKPANPYAQPLRSYTRADGSQAQQQKVVHRYKAVSDSSPRGYDRAGSADQHGQRTSDRRTTPKPSPSKYKVAKSPKFIDSRPAPKFLLKLYADNKDTCLRARNELGKRMKAEFLYEEQMPRQPKISREDKNRIVKLLGKYHVDTVKASGKYILKGHKESVSEVVKQILQILLDAKETVRDVPQRKRHDISRNTADFMPFLAYEDIRETPDYWKYFQPGHPIKNALAAIKGVMGGSKCKKVALSARDPEYTSIIKLITSTWQTAHIGKGQDAKGLDGIKFSNIQVTQIERIENLDIYNQYTQKRVQFFEKLASRGHLNFPDITSVPVCTGPIKTSLNRSDVLMRDMYSEINECYLFHGTKAELIKTICNDGLDSRLGSGKAMFGSGVYGAESPTKADQYTDSKDKRTTNGLQMFLIRMILGSSYVCIDKNPRKYRKPPCTNLQCLKDDCRDDRHKPFFDSIVGDKSWLFREFVAYEKEQCYPEYLITYNRVQ